MPFGDMGWALLISLCIVQGMRGSYALDQARMAWDKTPLNSEYKFHWAVLVAGSKHFYNYRHQADVCHAYQLLRANGMDDDHIVTMVYDDIAYSSRMPTQFRGKMFNSLGEVDVYSGCAKDYTGLDVTAANLLAVVTGNKSSVAGVGSGRVVESDSESNIFMFYSDHGASGAIFTPNGDQIYANMLNDALLQMHKSNLYNEVVIYMESCESASMFEGLLTDDIGVYALSASNSSESSWATYCPSYFYDESPYDLPHPLPDQLGTCLGDLFSVSWMEDTAHGDVNAETLHEQYVHVHDDTVASSANSFHGSVVEQFGSTAMDGEVIGNFMSVVGHERTPEPSKGARLEFLSRFPHLPKTDPLFRLSHKLPWRKATVEQRDADLVFFMHRAHSAKSLHEADEMLGKLRETLLKREEVDMAMRNVVKALHVGGHVQPYSDDVELSLEHYIMNVGDRPGKPLVDDWACLKEMVDTWQQEWGILDDYGRKYFRTFANLCNAGVEPGFLADAIRGTSIRSNIENDKRERVSSGKFES